jgi:serine/threonine protein kinase
MNQNSVRSMTCVGTPYYMSPEILEGQRYGNKTDMYSCGTLLFEVLYGHVPYVSCQDLPTLKKEVMGQNLLRQMLSDKYATQVRGAPLSRHMQQLILQMMAVRPDQRAGVHDLLQNPNSVYHRLLSGRRRKIKSTLHQQVQPFYKQQMAAAEQQFQKSQGGNKELTISMESNVSSTSSNYEDLDYQGMAMSLSTALENEQMQANVSQVGGSRFTNDITNDQFPEFPLGDQDDPQKI